MIYFLGKTDTFLRKYTLIIRHLFFLIFVPIFLFSAYYSISYIESDLCCERDKEKNILGNAIFFKEYYLAYQLFVLINAIFVYTLTLLKKPQNQLLTIFLNAIILSNLLYYSFLVIHIFTLGSLIVFGLVLFYLIKLIFKSSKEIKLNYIQQIVIYPILIFTYFLIFSIITYLMGYPFDVLVLWIRNSYGGTFSKYVCDCYP